MIRYKYIYIYNIYKIYIIVKYNVYNNKNICEI